MITQDMQIATIDGPFYAPNHSRIVKTVRKSDVIGAWLCVDTRTGEELIIQESKLIHSLSQTPKPK